MMKTVRAITIESFGLLVLLGTAHRAMAQDATTPYPRMAPVEQYLMDRSAEVALARSAAPASISANATILVMGRTGYETAVQGTNGFVCMVGRGWSSAADPDFWNPKVRVPICHNPAAARSYLLLVTRITDLALAGRTPAQVNEAIATAVEKKALPRMIPGAMCYMMSKEGYGGDAAPHWPSHLMFFYSDVDPAAWGANQPGSPVIAVADPSTHLTQFVITTPRWSDGTEDLSATAGAAGGTGSPAHEHH